MRAHDSRVSGDPLAAAMVALLQPPGKVSLERLAQQVRAAPADLATQLRLHGVDAVAFAAARPLEPEFPELVSQLDEARQRAWRTHLTALADLDVVGRAFESLDAPWAVIKGPVLVERAYSRADQRDYYDLDVLVHPSEFGRAVDLLVAAGVQPDRCNWDLIARKRRAQVGLAIGRTPLDLHWHPLNQARLRDSAHWDMTSLLGRIRMVDLAGRSVPVLDDCDAVMHTAAHATLSGGHRLVWHADVARSLASFPVTYQEIEERSRAAGIWPLVHLALLRASRTFGFEPPPHPPAWSRLATRFGADSFHSGANPRRTGEVWGRATYRGVARNIGEAGAFVLRRRIGPLARRFAASDRVFGPAASVEELQRDSAPSAMAAYLAQIDAEVRG
jgi:hypothetical protein